MINLPPPSAFLAVGLILCALIVTVLGIVLKLCGVLALSWWWVLCPVPAVLFGVVIIAGLIAIF